MTRTRPRSSSAKVRPGWVGQASVPRRPGRRSASTRKGPLPSSKSGRRDSRATKRCQASARKNSSREPSHSPVTSLASTRSSSGRSKPRRRSSSRRRSRLTWRQASPCTSRGARWACGTPLISTRRPPRTETFTSWRLAPMPTRTWPVERQTRPTSRMASSASSGWRRSGPVTVSIRGVPSRSVRQTIRWPRSETSRQESSSTLTWMIESERPRNGSWPLTPTMAVRWKPVGMDPSRYCLRAMWTSSTMSQPSIRHCSMATSTASWLTGKGGVSSIS